MLKTIFNGYEDVQIYCVEVETDNGMAILVPVNCEVTGEMVCWRTHIPIEVMRECPDCTPAYVSFDIVDADGKQLQDIRSITTF